MEDTSSKIMPMKQGYMEVNLVELAFMIKVELEVKATTKPKKSKEPTNQSTDYPKFYVEHIVKEVKLLKHPAYVNGKLSHDPLEVDYSKHLPIHEVNLGTKESSQMINIGAQLTSKMLDEYVALFKEFKNVITWSYKDMISIPPELCQHQLSLEDNAKIGRAHV